MDGPATNMYISVRSAVVLVAEIKIVQIKTLTMATADA